MAIKKKILIVSSIVAAFSVVFSTGFAAGNINASSRVSATPESSFTESSIVTSEIADPQTEASEPSTQTTEPTTQESTTQLETEKPHRPNVHPIQVVPSSTKEIVELFNDSANEIKSDKPTVYMTRDYFQVSNVLFGKTDITSTVSKINRNDQSKKEILPAEFPVGGETWASKLKPEAVQSAECTTSGEILQIKIVLKSESGIPLRARSNHGSCFSIPDNFDFLNVDIPGIKLGELTLTYSGCYINCTIDKTSGQLIKADYHIQAKGSLQITLAGILKKNCSATITSDTSFEIGWDAA